MTVADPVPNEIPLKARIHLSHAYFQRIADLNAVDLLHIKGYAFGEDTYRPDRASTDVDLLVRPAHVQRLMVLLNQDGWQVLTHFETGSIFEHAATVYHPSWGLADVHRYFPGVGFADPARAFEQLWDQRRTKNISSFPCQVPSLLDSRLLVVVHSARARPSQEVTHLESVLEAQEWNQLRARAKELDAVLAFDTALGRIEEHRGESHYLMWKVMSQDSPFYLQWLARMQRARGVRAKTRLLTTIFSVNEDHLAMSLGHVPTTAEKRKKFFARFYSLGGPR